MMKNINRSNFPDFFSWKDANNNFTMWTYVSAKMSIGAAIGMSAFLCPTLINVDGAYLIEESNKMDRLAEWRLTTGSDVQRLEKAINSWEVKDFFNFNPEKNINAESIELLGKQIQYLWSLTLLDRYPHVQTVVELIGDNTNLDPLVVVVYVRRHDAIS